MDSLSTELQELVRWESGSKVSAECRSLLNQTCHVMWVMSCLWSSSTAVCLLRMLVTCCFDTSRPAEPLLRMVAHLICFYVTCCDLLWPVDMSWYVLICPDMFDMFGSVCWTCLRMASLLAALANLCVAAGAPMNRSRNCYKHCHKYIK